MNKLENLEQEAFDNDVNVYNYDLGDDELKGLYLDGNIALSDKLYNTAERSCVLAEELGHHHTTVGNILDLNQPGNRKQERQARVWAYNRQIGLNGLIRAYEHGCTNRHEIAEYLEVTVEFLQEAIICYQDKYGIGQKCGKYYIMFIPSLQILKII